MRIAVLVALYVYIVTGCFNEAAHHEHVDWSNEVEMLSLEHSRGVVVSEFTHIQ